MRGGRHRAERAAGRRTVVAGSVRDALCFAVDIPSAVDIAAAVVIAAAVGAGKARSARDAPQR